MKKIITILLALSMIIVLASCGGQAASTESMTVGMLSKLAVTEEEINADSQNKIVFFDNLSSMLMALQSGKIDAISGLPEIVGKYVVSRSNEVVMGDAGKLGQAGNLKYCMAVMPENQDVYQLVNDALASMIEDGTIASYAEKYILACVDTENDPVPEKLPVIDGAQTVKVAVTGDLPPMDFVTADGNPAGFNVAVLSDIAKRANINIELVTMDSASRLTALSAGNVDVLFWVSDTVYDDADLTAKEGKSDIPEGLLLTAPYYDARICAIKAK